MTHGQKWTCSINIDFEILIDYEVDEEEEVHKDSIEVVSELFENLHQVMKLIVGKWCLKVGFS